MVACSEEKAERYYAFSTTYCNLIDYGCSGPVRIAWC